MKSPAKRQNPGGFTLIELIVTMAILSIILIMSLQVTESARNAIRISEARSNNDAIARRAFNPLARDLSRMVVRDDARIEFENRAGDDTIAFLTTQRGITADAGIGDRSVSLVRDAVTTDAIHGTRLIRGSLGHDYDDAPAESLQLDPDKAFPTIPTANEQEVSSNLLRFEIEYLVDSANGVVRQVTAPRTTAGLRGIVVTVATIDDRSLRTVRDSRFTSLAARFPDAVAASDTLAAWTGIRDKSARSGISGLPREVVESIRCYQRTFLLP